MSDYRLPDGTVPVLLSSDTATGLRAEAAAILAYLAGRPRVTPDRVADMLLRTRSPRRYRALAMVTDQAELLDALRAVVDAAAHEAVVGSNGPATSRRIGFVFPGQGSQHPGMGRLYYDLSPVYRAAVDECSALYEERHGHLGPVHYLLGDAGDYADTLVELQPARMFHMLGLAAMWQAVGVHPAATVGHSQGELAACVVAGTMPLRDAVLVVAHRAAIIEQVASGDYAMAVLGTDREHCEALLARHSGWAEVAVVNSPQLVAVAGERATIGDLVASATEQGRFAKAIEVSFPAHTSVMTRLRAEFERALVDELADATFRSSEITCYGATLGNAVTPELSQREYWYWNMRNRVRFDCAVTAAAQQVDTFVEIAEHPTLQLVLQDNLALVESEPGPSSRDFRVVGTSLRTATGLGEFTRNLAEVAVHDLNYPWDCLRIASSGGTPALPLRDFPSTVLNPKKLWASYRSAQLDPAPEDEAAPTRLVEEWTRLAQRSPAEPRRVLLTGHDERSAELAAALAARAARYGAEISDGDAAAETDAVMVLLPTSPATDQQEAVGELTEFAATMQRLPGFARGVTECWLVTTGAEAVGPDEIPASGHAAAAAAFRSLGLEHLGVAFRHVDLPGDAAAQDPRVLADRIIDAIHVADEPELAVRDGKLYVKRLVAEEDRGTATTPDLREVLILGGTGHVGLRFCEQLCRAGAGRITLVNRAGETPALTERLRAIRALGPAEIAVVACDITDSTAVAELAARYAERPVRVLVHAAVDYVWTELDSAAVAAATAAKVRGLDEVLRTVPLAEDCTVLLCSSFAATLGGRGQALYAGANRMLDALAVRLRAERRDCVAVQWGLWELPEQAELHSRVAGAGLLPMAPAAAVAAGFANRDRNSIVLSADWTRLRQIAETTGMARVFPEIAPPPGSSAPASPAVSVQTAVPAAAVSAPVTVDLAQIVRRELDRVMGGDGTEEIDGSIPLVALGIDSLQAVDLRTAIKAALDRDVSAAAILRGASLDDVVLLVSENQG
ncbi:nocobactin polyketide synthase NbtC [Nocardia sp. NBC_00508]|uniref:nocobactin polyketide synthase NbtC n=1 Tax=Nocardia sp. NBC_00508 TaxID=2975992 RepID=UPI002E81BD16|nr:nocobactin polyketide synthase NbtC [Nocardia sp. NBC_00508]WUD68714.1 nocobactin polyketide synthase NbtC [Nocardia sp. NBC_00508]